MRRDEQLGIQNTSVRVDSDTVTPANGGSFSGNERDKLFLSEGASSFRDVSGVSGLDHPGDGRTSSFLDLDRDGWMDMALASANAPLLQVFRNRVGSLQESANRFVAIRLVGGNDGSTPRPGLTARDGIGTRVVVSLGDRRLTRTKLCGTGFASQNTGMILVGLGKQGAADRIEFHWPGGTRSVLEDVPAGSLVTALEKGASGEPAFELEPYAWNSDASSADGRPKEPMALTGTQPLDLPRVADDAPSKLRMYTTMATWCASCRRELPYLTRLREAIDSRSLSMYAVPVDPEDGEEKLADYWKRFEPAYGRLEGLDATGLSALTARFQKELGHDGLPSTMVLNEAGDILLVRAGIPTLSEIQKLLPD